MNHDLIKRYIYAVCGYLPAKAQPEIEKEIENMIAELLDARCGDRQPGEDDIRAVLTELGAPEELAVKYSGDENRALISGIYLLWFKKIVALVLPIAAAGVAFATFLSGLIGERSGFQIEKFLPEMIARVISGALSAAVHAFLWITVIFIILERKKVNFGGEDFLSKLPPVPDKRAQIRIHEPVIDIFCKIAVAVLFLAFPYLMGVYFESTVWIPVFDEAYIRESWYLIVLWTAFPIAHAVAKLTERRYSRRLAFTTIVTHLFTGITAALFFADDRVMNPVFTEKIGSLTTGDNAFRIGQFLSHLNFFFLAIILFALLLDIGVTAFRAFRYDK